MFQSNAEGTLFLSRVLGSSKMSSPCVPLHRCDRDMGTVASSISSIHTYLVYSPGVPKKCYSQCHCEHLFFTMEYRKLKKKVTT